MRTGTVPAFGSQRIPREGFPQLLALLTAFFFFFFHQSTCFLLIFLPVLITIRNHSVCQPA